MRHPLGLRAATGAAGAANPNAWDITYASFTGATRNWFYIGDREPSPTDVFFKSDGTKFYVIGAINDRVQEFTLSSAWDVATASFVQNFSVAAQDTNPQSIFFKPDGTKMYILGNSGDDVNEYSLSTAWDVSTASYIQNFAVGGQESNPTGLFFKDDGTKMYVIGTTGDDVNEYNLSSAWNIATATYVQVFSVATQDASPQALFFKNDGTKMYILGGSGDDVNEYNLSTAWDVSTATYVSNFNISKQDLNVTGLFFKDDGTKMYIVGSVSDCVAQYSLSTPWDISTATFTNPSTDFLSLLPDTSPTSLFFKPDGTRLYTTGNALDSVREYSLSSAWQIETASFVQSFSVSTQESAPQALYFRDDGTSMYITGNSGDDVNEYTLSTAWDVSTASYVRVFSVAAQDTNPFGLAFKDDGSKMYVVGTTNDTVSEYNLSTPWNVSTASFLQSFSFGNINPTGVSFKPDGTAMYVVTVTELRQYGLTTAWDVSTASLQATQALLSLVLNAVTVQCVTFKSDGSKMYILDNNVDCTWCLSIN